MLIIKFNIVENKSKINSIIQINSHSKKQEKLLISMNRQYLKSLQERAQKLLQISSDEGSQLQNFNLSKTKSRRVDLNEVLSGTDLNQLKIQFEDYRNTDVELLKKCISMTNQNSQLKRQLKSYQTENSQLKAQNNYLQKELQNFKLQLMRMKQKLSTKSNKDDSPYNKLEQNDQFSFITKTPNEQIRQKSLSSYKLSSFKSNRVEQQSRYTEQQVQQAQERYKREITQLQQRLKVSNQKREKMQQMLTKEKEKSRKLWKFINQQIPQLRDIVTKLTNKVDLQVQSLLLKDINQNQFDNMNFNKSRQKRKGY